ncbi:MAG: hypothetical protein JWP91_3700 [Fibrobacteres bacterium]|nr:hypothetical protein [Fibrobacterota bacterium]
MQIPLADFAAPAAQTATLTDGPTRTITLGRNRLNTIENWSKPIGKSARLRERLDGRSLPLPVSSFIRTVTLAASRKDGRDLPRHPDPRA